MTMKAVNPRLVDTITAINPHSGRVEPLHPSTAREPSAKLGKNLLFFIWNALLDPTLFAENVFYWTEKHRYVVENVTYRSVAAGFSSPLFKFQSCRNIKDSLSAWVTPVFFLFIWLRLAGNIRFFPSSVSAFLLLYNYITERKSYCYDNTSALRYELELPSRRWGALYVNPDWNQNITHTLKIPHHIHHEGKRISLWRRCQWQRSPNRSLVREMLCTYYPITLSISLVCEEESILSGSISESERDENCYTSSLTHTTTAVERSLHYSSNSLSISASSSRKGGAKTKMIFSLGKIMYSALRRDRLIQLWSWNL